MANKSDSSDRAEMLLNILATEIQSQIHGSSLSEEHIFSAVKSDGIFSSYSDMALPAHIIFFFNSLNSVSGLIKL